ncbi:alpha/beta hydrolase [Georgenia halophila]|uniref:Alpha/beta hydrolase n=1 Tax=Georgenia halophila TaxID=620889 RepID=A0ABP8LL01_9MICO
MPTVVSQDGTPIAYMAGDTGGQAVVLVGGGLDAGEENAGLIDELPGWTAATYARRGRGESGDSQPYAVEREIEDIAALIEELGGTAHLFGASSGGALALAAAAAGLPVQKVAVYEVPYMTDEPMVAGWATYRAHLATALEDGRRGDAVALFMALAGASEADIAGARASEYWQPLEALAHTLAYDAACLGDGRVPTEMLARIGNPVLVATGAAADPVMGGLQPGFFDDAADALVAALPRAERAVIPLSGHQVDPAALAPVLEEFFER